MKIQILSPDLGLPTGATNHDYWVRKHTEEAVVSMQHELVPHDSSAEADIQLTFLGMSSGRQFIRPLGQFRAAWIYSRPDEYGRQLDFLSQFDKVYGTTNVHSRAFLQETQQQIGVLPIATNKTYKTHQTQYIADVAYMGSANEERRRLIIKLANRGFKIVVAGRGWGQVKHRKIKFTKEFWPNEDFSTFFSKAPLAVYETSNTFVNYGIVPIRIMDIYVSSDSLCITNMNSGLAETFAEEPPQFSNFEDLVQQVKRFLKRPSERNRLQKKIRQSIKRTYQDLVTDVIVDAMQFWGSLRP